MLFLLIAVLLGACIYWLFRYAGNRKLSLFTIILINYPVCVVFGLIHIYVEVGVLSFNPEIILWSAIMGLLFISTFNFMAMLTRNESVGTSSIVSRLSMVLPTLFFFLFYDTEMTLFNWVGLVFAITSVLVLNLKKGQTGFFGWLPLVVFIGYGFVDIGLQLAEMRIGHDELNFHLLSVGIFFFAGLYGLIYKGFKRMKIDRKHLAVGMILGAINYYSIVFFLLALNKSGFSPSVIFPLNGILILVLATLGSILFFREHFSQRKVLALGLAIVAIVLLGGNV